MSGFDNEVVHAVGIDLSGGTPVANKLATDGFLYIGSTASNPVAAALTGGTGITITNASGSITIDSDNNGTVSSVSGTANRITISGTAADPIVDIASTYIGQSSITTLGTVTTGTWNADVVTVPYGGSARATATAYAVICGGTTSTAAHQSIASVGTSGQVLTSNGAAALPTFQATAGDGGSWIFVASVTADDDATVVFTSIASTYDQYMFVFDEIVPATDSAAFRCRTSTNNGVSYDSTGSDYKWGYEYNTAGAAASNSSETADTITMTLTIGSAAGESLSGMLQLCAPASTTYTIMRTQLVYVSHDAIPVSVYGSGMRISAADVDAIQFYMSSGNITSGTIRLYGIKNS